MNPRPSLAVFSPVAPVRSGISDYTEALLPYLAESYQIDLYLDGYRPVSPEVRRLCRCWNRPDFEWRRRLIPYATVLYQVGNHRAHQYLYPTLFRVPGVVVLHDANLHRARALEHLQGERLGDYLAEIHHCHGDDGERAGWVVARGYQGDGIFDGFPMLRLICAGAHRLVVHNRYSADLTAEHLPADRVDRVPAPWIDTGLPDPESARRMLGLDPAEMLIASFGFIAPGKGLETVLAAFSRLLDEHPRSRLLLVGDVLEESYRSELLGRLPESARSRLTVTGYVPSEQFRAYLAAADVALNLRYPTQGESSSALLRIMGAGKPVLIPRYRQFREIPGDTCLHVDLWPNEEESVFRALSDLAADPVEGRRIGRRAGEFVRREHPPERWAEGILASLKRATEDPAPPAALARRCELRHVRILPMERQLAVPLVGLGPAGESPLLLEPLSRAAGELGLWSDPQGDPQGL